MGEPRPEVAWCGEFLMHNYACDERGRDWQRLDHEASQIMTLSRHVLRLPPVPPADYNTLTVLGHAHGCKVVDALGAFSTKSSSELIEMKMGISISF